jgi:hypothetical protein
MAQSCNFIQCAGTRDGASHLANILNLWYHNLSADPIDQIDPCVIVKLDMAQAFQCICRALGRLVGLGEGSALVAVLRVLDPCLRAA